MGSQKPNKEIWHLSFSCRACRWCQILQGNNYASKRTCLASIIVILGWSWKLVVILHRVENGVQVSSNFSKSWQGLDEVELRELQDDLWIGDLESEDIQSFNVIAGSVSLKVLGISWSSTVDVGRLKCPDGCELIQRVSCWILCRCNSFGTSNKGSMKIQHDNGFLEWNLRWSLLIFLERRRCLSLLVRWRSFGCRYWCMWILAWWSIRA